ncbi:aldo/keto reductase [Actinomycetospora cinnamomea]|uniref:Aryl-alcohol dehydrogenase-like predicted oxidoreductase n=1 Tax=Actinomycetospora cinnamomea TaxID=663609 RepID=A0A2U1F6E5_9PSEU|nr:aldo/keto reductase [Actinomycetospora cinnamomea]PVZ07755.1 aryl-alcohol dehydrogenase-like predicted oxidoreductase [Actinomycetospora cinnamomea]
MTTVSASDAGTLRLAGREVPRMGFGAMRLPGPGVWGPPPDRDRAIAVCRRAVELGVRVIDTAWYYGTPDRDVANEVLAEALRPYPDDLVFVTKLGGRRTDDAGWAAALRPEQLRKGCERDLAVLGVESVPVAHLRWIDDGGTDVVPFSDALGTMIELRDEGKIGAIGLSNVDLDQVRTAQQHVEVATVSNLYSPLQRDDDPVVDHCDAAGIPYLPFFPLAVGAVADPGAVPDLAADLGVAPAQVALAWLLHRSAWMLPIPGTGDPAHLEENVAAGSLRLPDDALARLDSAGRPAGT